MPQLKVRYLKFYINAFCSAWIISNYQRSALPIKIKTTYSYLEIVSNLKDINYKDIL